jgi:hypothetical protein
VKKHLLLLGFALAYTPAIHAQNVIGEVFSSDASVRGSVVLSGNGTHVLSGAQVSAGDGVALLKLERGGEVRICPKTNLSLSVDPSGKALVLGLNAGSMELNYSLHTAADSLITPDFRVQLISPGAFHLAISVSPSGDTCMRSLPGNDAAVFIAEMMGPESYQLSPGKNVMFRAGKISGATDAPPACGCPEMKPETDRTRADATRALASLSAPEAVQEPGTSPEASLGTPQSNAAEPHLEVDGGFVYRGKDAVQNYYGSVARLSLSTDNSRLALALLPHVSGPTAKTTPPEKKPGAFHRFGSFLGRLFRK